MAESAPLVLERFAELRAEIDAGEESQSVLDRERVEASTWSAAQAFWLKKMADEAALQRFETTQRYQALYVAKKKIFARRRANQAAKDARPAMVEPAVAALDSAARILEAHAVSAVPAITVPTPPVVEAPVAAPSFELPPPVDRPPAPRIAEPARVGPRAAATEDPRTAPISGMTASAALPFAPGNADPPLRVARPPLVPAPPSSDEEPPRTATVDIEKLLRTHRASATPFPTAPQKLDATMSVPVRAPPPPGAATPFSATSPSPTAATPFAAKPASPGAPLRRDSTPFAMPVVEQALESDDDDDAPKTKMLSEEIAKALTQDIPMASRAPAPSSVMPAVPPSSRSPGGDETLPANAGVRAIRPPDTALPFQRTPSSVMPIVTPSGVTPSSVTPSSVTPPSGATPSGEIRAAAPTTPGTPFTAAPSPSASNKIFSLQQFASLTAEIAVSPERIAEARQRYGVTEAQHKAESQRWTEEFATNTELRTRYFGLVQSYREYLQRQASKGG